MEDHVSTCSEPGMSQAAAAPVAECSLSGGGPHWRLEQHADVSPLPEVHTARPGATKALAASSGLPRTCRRALRPELASGGATLHIPEKTRLSRPALRPGSTARCGNGAQPSASERIPRGRLDRSIITGLAYRAHRGRSDRHSWGPAHCPTLTVGAGAGWLPSGPSSTRSARPCPRSGAPKSLAFREHARR